VAAPQPPPRDVVRWMLAVQPLATLPSRKTSHVPLFDAVDMRTTRCRVPVPSSIRETKAWALTVRYETPAIESSTHTDAVALVSFLTPTAYSSASVAPGPQPTH
jgi:hypothetical protein